MSDRLNITSAIAIGIKALKESSTSRLDTEVLLAHLLKKNTAYLRTWPEKELSDAQKLTFHQLLEQRSVGQPIAYLVGEREFWSRSFIVSPDVLIPRPDTELLIDIIQTLFSPTQAFSALDMGTGSGAIAVTLACEFNKANIIAIDASHNALLVAQKNITRHSVNNIQLIKSDWFNDIRHLRVDLIVSNPPYIDKLDPHLSSGDVQFEPDSALVSGQHGLQDIKQIINGASEHLNNQGFLLFEHGYQQGREVHNLLELAGFRDIKGFKDIQGHIRATLGQKPTTTR